MKKHTITSMLMAGAILVVAGLADAKKATVSILIGDVGVHSGERGNFYVVNVAIPGDLEGKRLDRVVLEFAVDASPTSLEDSVASPAVGVFPLTQTYAGESLGDAPGMDASPVTESAVPSVRPLTTGENRLVRMDITAIVRGWLANPSSNHGLVIGSLTGPEVGTIILKDELPGSDSAVKVTFSYQNRFGDPISSSE